MHFKNKNHTFHCFYISRNIKMNKQDRRENCLYNLPLKHLNCQNFLICIKHLSDCMICIIMKKHINKKQVEEGNRREIKT